MAHEATARNKVVMITSPKEFNNARTEKLLVLMYQARFRHWMSEGLGREMTDFINLMRGTIASTTLVPLLARALGVSLHDALSGNETTVMVDPEKTDKTTEAATKLVTEIFRARFRNSLAGGLREELRQVVNSMKGTIEQNVLIDMLQSAIDAALEESILVAYSAIERSGMLGYQHPTMTQQWFIATVLEHTTGSVRLSDMFRVVQSGGPGRESIGRKPAAN